KRITDIRQVETTARYLGTALYWIAASINIKPGHDCVFRSIRSRIGIEVRSAIRIHSINRELNFFYRF
ncbi:hypothetical protein, partial [Escherichia coli]|uniref:hypothetical protein n=1 Tax=Escherichia coli TaxID=562 RepID=UPI003CF8545D